MKVSQGIRSGTFTASCNLPFEVSSEPGQNSQLSQRFLRLLSRRWKKLSRTPGGPESPTRALRTRVQQQHACTGRCWDWAQKRHVQGWRFVRHQKSRPSSCREMATGRDNRQPRPIRASFGQVDQPRRGGKRPLKQVPEEEWGASCSHPLSSYRGSRGKIPVTALKRDRRDGKMR